MLSSMMMNINMAIPIKTSSKLISSSSPTNNSLMKPRSLKCIASPNSSTTPPPRRSGNYNPSLWDFNYIQSLSCEYGGDGYTTERVSELVAQVKMMLEKELIGVAQLELIDKLQNLAISYHFEDNIKQVLFTHHKYCLEGQTNLYSTSLMFRLLRQHGFTVPQEVFECFRDEKGDFEAKLEEDRKGVLQLYEASFLLTQGEETLEMARLFSTNILHKKIAIDGLIINDDYNLSLMVDRALEVPLHWTFQQLNAKWFIEAYATTNVNPILLQLAKLNFNILQQSYQQEIKEASRWWEHTGLAKKLSFARDRVVECFLWTLGPISQPQYGYARIVGTKVNLMIAVIDDMCDIYCTLEEVQLFNSIIQRWDIDAIDKLPEYMQICFLALNNIVNDLAYDVLKEQGYLIIPYLRKSWQDICRAYEKEAAWYSKGYMPSLEEYMNNAWYTSGPSVMLSHEYFALKDPIQEEAVKSLYEYHNMVRYSGVNLRLINDLGTSQDEMERGDVPKSVQCYMHETGCSKEEAKEHVNSLIRDTWKKMNKEGNAKSKFSKDFITSTMDMARFTHFMYQHGDGHGVQNLQFKQQITSLLFQPIL